MTEPKIIEPVQPVEAIVQEYNDDNSIEVEFAPKYNFTSARVTLLEEITEKEIPVGTKIVVDSAWVKGNFTLPIFSESGNLEKFKSEGSKVRLSLRAYDLKGKLICENFPGEEYERAEVIRY